MLWIAIDRVGTCFGEAVRPSHIARRRPRESGGKRAKRSASPTLLSLGWRSKARLRSGIKLKKIKLGLFSPKGVIPISDWTNIDAHSSRVKTNVNIKTEVRGDIRERIRDD